MRYRNRIRASVIVAALLLAGAGSLALVETASAAPTTSPVQSSQVSKAALTKPGRGSSTVSPAAANSCHLPTSAGPGGGYSTSYGDCVQCSFVAADNTLSISNPYVWYCTYNPSNGLNDLHYG